MIKKITDIRSAGLDQILTESQKNGYGMIERLITEWESGATDFSGENEAYFAYEKHGEVLGVGGINEEPYLRIKEYGRMRHLYVLKKWRRKGVGREIVSATIEFAKDHYNLMTLMTPKDGSADVFYESLGFKKCDSLERVSHTLILQNQLSLPMQPTASKI